MPPVSLDTTAILTLSPAFGSVAEGVIEIVGFVVSVVGGRVVVVETEDDITFTSIVAGTLSLPVPSRDFAITVHLLPAGHSSLLVERALQARSLFNAVVPFVLLTIV